MGNQWVHLFRIPSTIHRYGYTISKVKKVKKIMKKNVPIILFQKIIKVNSVKLNSPLTYMPSLVGSPRVPRTMHSTAWEPLIYSYCTNQNHTCVLFILKASFIHINKSSDMANMKNAPHKCIYNNFEFEKKEKLVNHSFYSKKSLMYFNEIEKLHFS